MEDRYRGKSGEFFFYFYRTNYTFVGNFIRQNYVICLNTHVNIEEWSEVMGYAFPWHCNHYHNYDPQSLKTQVFTSSSETESNEM